VCAAPASPQSTQYVLEVSGFSATAVCIGWMGPELLSAHEVGCSLAGLAFVVAGGFGTGATVRVGEAFGRGDRAGVERAGRVALAVTTVLMGGIGSLLILAPEAMARIYTSEPMVLEAVVGVLGLTGLLAVFDGLQLVAGEALRATSDSRTPLVVHMLGQWLVGLPLGYTLAYPLGWGLPGFWVGIVVSIGLVALVLTAVFLRGGWARRVQAPGPAP